MWLYAHFTHTVDEVSLSHDQNNMSLFSSKRLFGHTHIQVDALILSESLTLTEPDGICSLTSAEHLELIFQSEGQMLMLTPL